ncbi:K02A2.6-like [Cordylochernes scorpioides]|uniref:RNA-directed DNA polymerase n=1 Tax=Cordylochernes scorpioides TaxID=51811 RepID=A0ABY6LVW8_9ARAC|nr:K02A2.6-like [Cordylochernes scorpioides]
MNSYCSKCKKKGHYAKVCRSEAINEINSEIAFLGSVEDNSKKWIVPIKVNNRQINFKIDTGADVNVLPLQNYYQSFQRIKLEKSDKILQGPNGIPLETVGMIHVKLQNKGQHLNSKIYIVDKLKQPLLSGENGEKLNIVRTIQQLSSGGRGGQRGRLGSGDNRGCYNCGEEGHRKFECTKPARGGGRGRGQSRDGGSNNTCYNCGEVGHRKYECTNNTAEDGGQEENQRKSKKARYTCGEFGHKKDDCPKSGTQESGDEEESSDNKEEETPQKRKQAEDSEEEEVEAEEPPEKKSKKPKSKKKEEDCYLTLQAYRTMPLESARSREMRRPPTSTSTWLSRRCKDDQEQETEEDCPTPTASSTRDGRMQRDNQDQDPEKSLPSMPAVHTRYGRAVKIPRRLLTLLIWLPCNFWLYLKLKRPLKGKQFQTKEDIMTGTTAGLKPLRKRARFNQRCQQEGEKVNEFITALHSLAEHCNFEMLHDELIRDRIVVGVRDRALSERMQLDTDLTLVKATLMAKQLESVKEQQSSLYQQNSVDQIKKMPNHIKETKRHEPKIRQFKSNQLGGSSHGCTRCGNSNNHDWKNCPAMNSYCNKCMKKGHYAKVCRSEAINEIKSEIAFLGSVEDNSKKWIVPIKVNNRQVNFKIDTGADVNVLPLQYYYQSFQRIKLEKSDKVLQGPNGIPLETVGMIHVKLQNKGQHLNSKIYIVDKLKQPLLSGETSEKLNIVRMIQQLSSNFLNPKREFPKIFNGLGHAKINYKISLQPDAKPYALCTPRRVPIPLMKQVKEQLEEMTRLGIIESVEEPTEWCARMVAVSKPGGKIRICVDLTKLNQYIRRENYPLPATEHILGQLGNACYFSKLDANSGFWQFGLAKESQKLTTFITPFGRFFFKRIPFGITSAPEIFQRKMTQLLGNIEGVVCFMDDIVVYGSSLEEHNERCQFGVKTVKFLGHTLSSEGLFIDEEKLDAITKMEAPRSTKELKSFLGMVNYLGKFIPNLADKLQPLNSLLSTKNEWVWDEPQKKSFNLLKQELISRPNLALFDPSRTTIVSADASSFGIGGVLRQEQPDGSLKPIAYVSRTLSETEKRYSQIEKEGLAIVWTCERLKDYVTGIKIHIETDHKPLIAIFTSKSLEDMTPRLQRLKMRMMRYSYQISHIAGKKQIVADMLSRKPMSKPHKDELEEELSAYIQSIEFPATEERLLEISRKQKEDSLCSQLAKYCMSGWPKNKREVDPELRGYWQFQEDLTYQNGLLLRGQRILIPKTLRKDILEKLHQGHFGINKCRSRAKESVWWLGISQEIERMVSSCTKCLKERKPKHEPLMPSEFPIRPWQKVGMDLFYLNGRWYLIVCDYYSRYPEISLLQNLTAQEVIGRLKSIFARHGTPETVRSDNGPQFQKVLGSEFSKFSKEWSFKHITSSPKFPQSNGFIEAIIKNIKQSFKKEEDCYLTLQAYRTMPLESGYSPAELLMGRRLRTSVPAIESSLMPRYLDSEALQEREKRRVINQKRLYDKRHDVHSLPPLQQGDSVWVRDQRVKGKVLHKSEEPRSYWVQTPQGKVRRNRLHLTPLPKMGSTMDASEDDQELETEEDCPTPTASSTRDGRMQRDNQDQDPEKSLPSMPAVHTRYGRAVKIPRRFL